MSIFSAKNYETRIFGNIFSLSNIPIRLMIGVGGLFEIRQLLENYFLFENICSLFSIARQTREETDFREKKYRFEFNRG